MKGIHAELYTIAKNQLIQAQADLEDANVALNEAIKLGDLSEASEYDAAKEKMKSLQQLVEDLRPVLNMEPIPVQDTVDIIEPGSIIDIMVYRTTKKPMDVNSAAFHELTSEKPIFQGRLLFGGGLVVHELLRDKLLSEKAPIGAGILGRPSGSYSIKVPAGYANIIVHRVKTSELREQGPYITLSEFVKE